MSIEERETIVRIGYGPDGQASIWTTEKSIMTKCRRAGWRMEQETLSKRGAIVGQEWVSSSKDIRIGVKKAGREKVKTGFALRAGNSAGATE